MMHMLRRGLRRQPRGSVAAVTLADITFVGSTNGGAVNGANVTLTLPAHQAGDLILISGGFSLFSVPAAVPGVDAGEGYTSVVNFANGSAFRMAVVFSIATDPVDTSVVCLGTGSGNDAICYAAMIFRGVDQVNPIDVAAVTATGNSTDPDAPEITSATAKAVAVACAASGIHDTAMTAPSGYGNFVQRSVNDFRQASCAMAWLGPGLAGGEAINPPAFTDWLSGAWCAATVLLRPGVVL